MIHPIRTFLREPRLPAGPHRTRWDYVFVIVLGGLAALGVPFEDDVAWRPLAAVLGATFVLALWWRRSHPFLALVVPFTLLLVVEIAAQLAGVGSALLGGSFLASMILLYAVWRWGSGREAVTGLIIVVVSIAVVDVNLGTPPGEAVSSAAIIVLWAAIGAAIRSQVRLRLQTISEAQLNERQRLARELHDTVAHHVSAIAVQAQAGQAIVTGDPNQGLKVLTTIEDVANLTLDEMRRMVGWLRATDDDPTQPPEVSGIAGIRRLSEPSAGPRVQLEVSGDVEDLEPALAAGLYRLVQESLTNARRHSRAATMIRVVIRGTDEAVELAVVDDGAPALSPTAGDRGFGLIGMSERASMLGGSFTAKPGPERGWVVTANLPREPMAPNQ